MYEYVRADGAHPSAAAEYSFLLGRLAALAVARQSVESSLTGAVMRCVTNPGWCAYTAFRNSHRRHLGAWPRWLVMCALLRGASRVPSTDLDGLTAPGRTGAQPPSPPPVGTCRDGRAWDRISKE